MNSTITIPSRTSSTSVHHRVFYALFATTLMFCLTGCGGGSKAGGLGPLEQFVFSGPVEGWSGSMEDGVYWLENKAGNPDDIRYFYTPSSPGDGGKRSAQIDIMTAELHPEGRAGLLYGYTDSPKFYYLVMISGSGTVEIYQRDDNGFRLSQSNSINSSKSGSVHLEARESGRTLSIIADGKTISTLENDHIGKGELGIAAFGLGKFGFTNYEETPSSERSQQSGVDRDKKQIAEQPKKIKRSAYIDYIDPKTGIVQYSAPLHKGWRFDNNPNDQLSLTGPNGTEVYDSVSLQFVHSDDPFSRQAAQQMSGVQFLPLMPLDRYLQQPFATGMQQRGYKLVNKYPMPKIVEIMEIFGAGMPKEAARTKYDAIGAEWESSDGSRAFTLLIQSILQKQQSILWFVNASELYASNSEYEKAKNEFIYASVNMEFNPEWQIAANKELLANIMRDRQMYNEQARQMQIRHIERMNAILTRGAASSSVAKINSDILDISHAGYLKRDSMVSTGQTNTINMIGEYSVISNPTTGELYKVDAGAQNHWVNAQGIHFDTENSLYDPRTDTSISDQQWERFDVVR